jgi:hypothetical protein
VVEKRQFERINVDCGQRELWNKRGRDIGIDEVLYPSKAQNNQSLRLARISEYLA